MFITQSATGKECLSQQLQQQHQNQQAEVEKDGRKYVYDAVLFHLNLYRI